MTRNYSSRIDGELPDPITFDLDGHTYTCRELGPLEVSEVARLQGGAADSPESIAFIATFLNMLLGRDQYIEFRKRCADFGTPLDTLVAIIEGVFEDFTARPTQPQSESSAGLRTTEQKSSDVSSSRVIERLEGRPDLQVAVLAARRS
jgi:hypothetical protein